MVDFERLKKLGESSAAARISQPGPSIASSRRYTYRFGSMVEIQEGAHDESEDEYGFDAVKSPSDRIQELPHARTTEGWRRKKEPKLVRDTCSLALDRAKRGHNFGRQQTGRLQELTLIITSYAHELLNQEKQIEELKCLLMETERKQAYRRPSHAVDPIRPSSRERATAENTTYHAYFTDPESSESIKRCRDKVMHSYLREGRLDKMELQETIHEVVTSNVMRWGDPTKLVKCAECERLNKRLTDVEGRLMSSQKDSLKEIVLLRKSKTELEQKLKVASKLRTAGAPTTTAEGTSKAMNKHSTASAIGEAAVLEREQREMEAKLAHHTELYEPLMHFKEEERELMIDVVNSKVRAILTMDSLAKGNKLPFGMKPLPEEDAIKKVQALEEEKEELQAVVEKIKMDKFKLMDRCDEMERQLEKHSNDGVKKSLTAMKSAQETAKHKAELEEALKKQQEKFEEDK